MPLVKLITPKIINLLWRLSAPRRILKFSLCVALIISISPAFSQDNSPYTRYGLGDIVPSTNINSRGMGSISAGVNDAYSINFNNPASYAYFQAYRETRSKKLRYGRAILDIGVNLDNRTLIDPQVTGSFTASNILFSHMQVAMPLSTKTGLSFGLRPMSRISYNISRRERLFDENTGLPIDSSITLNQGDGGSYLASAGIGHRISIGKWQTLSFGANVGYLFGKKDYSAKRILVNDSVEYTSGNYQTKTTFGKLYVNLGLQYQKVDTAKGLIFTVGAFGNLKQTINASQDIIRETFYYNASGGTVQIDSVFMQEDIKGKIEYPSSFTAGFTFQQLQRTNKSGWMIGIDFNQASWQNYRFYGLRDSTQKKWELRVGGEIRPSTAAARRGYFGNVAYRAGFFFGPDYIKVNEKLPVFGASFGLGLPLPSVNRQSPGQATIINLAFEFIKRGNNQNLLKENLFRISIGFSLSDYWFVRKQYD